MLPAGVVLITPVNKDPNPDAVSPLGTEATLPPPLYPSSLRAMPPRPAGLAQGCSTILSLRGEKATKWALFEIISIDSFNHPA